MLIEARFHNHNKSFILYNIKDITQGDFPVFYVREFVEICNEVLKLNKKATIRSGEELLDALV